MSKYKATAAQASFIAKLANQVSNATFEAAYADAARLNGNRPTSRETETPTQAARRLSKTAASRLLDALIAASK